jgi:hypothetical protein
MGLRHSSRVLMIGLRVLAFENVLDGGEVQNEVL